MQSILIIKLGAVGDVVHTLPVLDTLRAARPESHLGWVVEEAAAPILQGNPALNELIVLERRKLYGAPGLTYIRSWLWELRSRGYDTAIDPHNLFKTGLIALFSGAGIRVGFRKLREGNFLFMNRWVDPPAGRAHAVEKYLSLLEPLGIARADWRVEFPLVWDPDHEKTADRFLSEKVLDSGKSGRDPVVAINPGANWPSKRWPPEKFARAADGLIERLGARVVVLWGPGERPLAEAVAGAMTRPAVLAPETTLKGLMPLLRRCRLLISGDTGPLHLAAALGVPTVALFGPSDPRRNGPYGKGHEVVQSTRPPATHWQAKEKGGEWMEAIPVEAVVEAAERVLGIDVNR